ETTKAEQTRVLEEGKAEAARILEMIKTGDPDKAADNLKFLIDAGLISDADRRRNIRNFLANRPAGKGPTLPSVAWTPGMSLDALLDSKRTIWRRLEDPNLTKEERDQLINELKTLDIFDATLRPAR